MNKLLNLEPLRNSSNIRALRRLYDDLEINIRSLESLNVVSGTYGQLLCPILLKLIPEDISLEYNRKRKSNSEFDVSELVNFIKTEVECRENTKLLHTPNNYSQEADEFKLDLSSLIDSLKQVKNTKRSVLRISSKLFDPIGYIAVFTIRIKIILQEIWEGGFDWDEELGKNLRTKWEKWCKEVHSLVELSIQRYYFKADEANEEFNEYQIVIFCDASERAYGAIAYIRYKTNSDFHVNFVSTKARVAPLKKLSLPRLELLATLIGSRLLETLRKVFKITNNYIMFSDLTVALSWIRGYAKQWKPFVSNRVLLFVFYCIYLK
ncbi:uncharacterized protein TNIN_47261 [Trichonephila inaurata madagascariensis]|uniref:Uncharacterized protein n=1 Tax=Trichonephila inaurata madagascariensis TaxID=2747483 RepID=A0A8X6YN39_9ARAC|nr:uncharacterized protein TNIN_47261 [Trichonephila inaurata madagascariensis]